MLHEALSRHAILALTLKSTLSRIQDQSRSCAWAGASGLTCCRQPVISWPSRVQSRMRRRSTCRSQRAATVGVHPKFVSMIRDLILERTDGAPRLALGDHGPSPDDCPVDCCPCS